ncbi:MAG TPA: hypothetical protein VGM82_20550 [Gemmatimonadaceae bacterium]|jgi:hypothetical protein
MSPRALIGASVMAMMAMMAMLRRAACALLGIALASSTPAVVRAQSPNALPSYRLRILGVFDTQSGEPVEGAEVIDLLGKVTAKTTATGTVTLSYLPEGETLLRIRKLGFDVSTMLVSISPDDTIPVTVLLKRTGQLLPTVFTTDSSVKTVISPGLREFELRRLRGGGYFVREAEMRKHDTKMMTSVARTIPGLKVLCNRTGTSCIPASGRQTGRTAMTNGGCAADIYVDGLLSNPADNNLERMRVDQFAAAEFYTGGAQTPSQYNKTGANCGVLLLWTRER